MISGLKIAVVGCGVMGRQFVRRLGEAGYRVAAWNRTPAKIEGLATANVSLCATPTKAANDADVIISMLTDGPSNEAVLLAPDASGKRAVEVMNTGGTLLIMSTISVHEAVAQAKMAAEYGVNYMDAPVSGGEKGAIGGTLKIMAGGDSSVLTTLRPVIDILGKVTHMGPVGTGTIAKLSNQTIVAATMCIVSEALIFAEKGGADPAAVREALLGGFADSTILNQHGERMIHRDWEPGGIAVNQVKDQLALLKVAEPLGLDLQFSRMALETFQQLCANGDGMLDHSAVYREIQRRCGIEPE